jgi:4-amino-4-deoxy-L-arabinose transferase-like glycosyltransferase
MIGRLRTIAVLAALALASAVAGLTALPPLDRDEARFAQASVQMIESGDYIRINFQDQARNKKPAGIYWLQAASVQAFSSPEARAIWAYRLPSVLGLLIAVIATYGAGCVLVGRRAAFAGAALLGVGALAGIEAGIAKTDAMLMAVTAVSMAALAALYEGRRRAFGVLFWLGLAAGVLIKGPVTPMVTGLAILALVIIDRRVRWLSPLLWWPGPLLAALMIAPWIYFVQKATGGAFLMDAFAQDLGPKLVSGHESHGGLPGTHLALLPFLFFPGVLFLVPGIVLMAVSFFKPFSDAEAAGLRFLAAWAIPSWIVFELIPTKLPHYVLPLYPALALTAGAAFAALADRRASIAPQLLSLLLFAVAGGLFTALLIVAPALINTGAVIDPEFNEVMTALERVPAIARILPILVAAGLFVLPLLLWRAPRAVLWTAIVAGLALQWGARNIVAPRIEPLWVSSSLSQRLEAYSLHPRSALAKPPLVSAGYNEPSLIFLTDTKTVLTDGAGAAQYAAEEAGRATLVEARERAAFEAGLAAAGASAVIVETVNGLNYSRGEQVSISIYRTTQRARRRPGEAADTAGLGRDFR